MVAGEAHDRELAVVGDFRRLKVARTLDLVVQIARSIDDAVVKGAPNGTRLQRGDALRLLGGAPPRGPIGVITRVAQPNLDECVTAPAAARSPARGDRKSAGAGKSVSGRVTLGGRGFYKKQKKQRI